MLEQLFLVEMPSGLVSFSIDRYPAANNLFWSASCQWINDSGVRKIASTRGQVLAETLAAMRAQHAEMTARPDYAAAKFAQYFGELAA